MLEKSHEEGKNGRNLEFLAAALRLDDVNATTKNTVLNALNVTIIVDKL